VRPAASWRRNGNWGRDAEDRVRRLIRAPMFMARWSARSPSARRIRRRLCRGRHVLIAPMAYERPDDLYFVWRDYGKIFDLKRGWLAGTDVAELQKSGGVIERQLAFSASRLLSTHEGADPIEVNAMVASPNLFDLLGVRPAWVAASLATKIGPTRAPVIVLTHQTVEPLGADRSIARQDGLGLTGSRSP
jgi:hypothetical protein